MAKIADKDFLVDLILPFSGSYKSDLGMPWQISWIVSQRINNFPFCYDYR